MTEQPEWQTRPEVPPAGAPPSPYSYPPPQGPYGYGVYPGAAPILRNGMGVAALVVAIIALLLFITVAGGVVFGITAVVLGFIGRARVRRSEADNGGIALSGIVLGVIAIIAGLLAVPFFWVPVFKQAGASDYVDCLQQAGQDSAMAQQCADELRQSFENHFTQTPKPVR